MSGYRSFTDVLKKGTWPTVD